MVDKNPDNEIITLIDDFASKEPTNDNPNTITEEEYLLECCRFNDIEGIKDVLSCGVVKLNYQDQYLNSALHMASANNNIEIVKLLLEAGIDLNLQNSSGNSALHWAAMNNNVTVVKMLIDKKANSKLKNNMNKTATEEAYERGNTEIADFLVEVEVNESKDSSIIQEEDNEIKELEDDLKDIEEDPEKKDTEEQ